MKSIQERAVELGETMKKKRATSKTIHEVQKVEYPNLISMEKLLSMDFPKNKWSIEKLVPHEGITILSGPPGNFKTWLLLLMGISITKGEKFLGQFQCSQSGVLIVDEEDHLRLLQERANLLGATKDTPIYFLSQQGFSLESETWIQKVLDICNKKKIDTIFFDSLVRIHDSDENEASKMSKVFKQIKRFCQAKRTVILTHHERKESAVRASGQVRLRGSSDISAAVDSHISMRKDRNEKGLLIVEQPKLRFDEETPSFEISVVKEEGEISFTYVGGHSSEVETGAQITEAILNIFTKSESKLPMKTIVAHVKDSEKIGEKAVQKTLKSMIESGLINSEKGEKNTKLCSLPEPLLETNN